MNRLPQYASLGHAQYYIGSTMLMSEEHMSLRGQVVEFKSQQVPERWSADGQKFLPIAMQDVLHVSDRVVLKSNCLILYSKS